MGEVYEAFDEKPQRRVAIKTIRSTNRLRPAARARFLQEARLYDTTKLLAPDAHWQQNGLLNRIDAVIGLVTTGDAKRASLRGGGPEGAVSERTVVDLGALGHEPLFDVSDPAM